MKFQALVSDKPLSAKPWSKTVALRQNGWPSSGANIGVSPVLHSHWILSALPGQQASRSGLDKESNAKKQDETGTRLLGENYQWRNEQRHAQWPFRMKQELSTSTHLLRHPDTLQSLGLTEFETHHMAWLRSSCIKTQCWSGLFALQNPQGTMVLKGLNGSQVAEWTVERIRHSSNSETWTCLLLTTIPRLRPISPFFECCLHKKKTAATPDLNCAYTRRLEENLQNLNPILFITHQVFSSPAGRSLKNLGSLPEIKINKPHKISLRYLTIHHHYPSLSIIIPRNHILHKPEVCILPCGNQKS